MATVCLPHLPVRASIGSRLIPVQLAGVQGDKAGLPATTPSQEVFA